MSRVDVSLMLVLINNKKMVIQFFSLGEVFLCVSLLHLGGSSFQSALVRARLPWGRRKPNPGSRCRYRAVAFPFYWIVLLQ